jgi:hypothetical protein
MRLQILRRRDRRVSGLSFLGGSSHDDALARHVIAEYRHGRPLGEILDDPYLRNRADERTRRRLLDRADVIEAVGDEVVGQLRSRLTAATG